MVQIFALFCTFMDLLIAGILFIPVTQKFLSMALETGHFPQFCAKEPGGNKEIFQQKHVLEGAIDVCLSLRGMDDSRSNACLKV